MERSEDAAGDLLEALQALPLFPLPEAVLLPGALMPLHVFEPRYRKMIRDALDGHRALAVVNIPDPDRADESGQPVIARVAGAGTIVDYTELPSGRYDILVRGRARVELEELPFEPPYRRAKAKVLLSTEEDVSSTQVAALTASATAFITVVRERDRTFDFRMPKLAEPGALVDHYAQHLLMDSRDRQRALETTRVGERVSFVTDTLVTQRLTLTGGPSSVN